MSLRIGDVMNSFSGRMGCGERGLEVRVEDSDVVIQWQEAP